MPSPGPGVGGGQGNPCGMPSARGTRGDSAPGRLTDTAASDLSGRRQPAAAQQGRRSLHGALGAAKHPHRRGASPPQMRGPRRSGAPPSPAGLLPLGSEARWAPLLCGGHTETPRVTSAPTSSAPLFCSGPSPPVWLPPVSPPCTGHCFRTSLRVSSRSHCGFFPSWRP